MIRNAIWNIYTEIGCTAFKSGHFSTAEKMFSAALEEAQEKWHPRHRLSASITNLATLYQKTGWKERASSLYRRVVGMYDRESNPDRSLLKAIDSLADLHFRDGNYLKAKTFYRKALHIFEELCGGDSLDLRPRLIRLSWIYAQQGQHNEALRYYNRAQALSKTQGRRMASPLH